MVKRRTRPGRQALTHPQAQRRRAEPVGEVEEEEKVPTASGCAGPRARGDGGGESARGTAATGCRMAMHSVKDPYRGQPIPMRPTPARSSPTLPRARLEAVASRAGSGRGANRKMRMSSTVPA